jgi:hypothetical protein
MTYYVWYRFWFCFYEVSIVFWNSSDSMVFVFILSLQLYQNILFVIVPEDYLEFWCDIGVWVIQGIVTCFVLHLTRHLVINMYRSGFPRISQQRTVWRYQRVDERLHIEQGNTMDKKEKDKRTKTKEQYYSAKQIIVHSRLKTSCNKKIYVYFYFSEDCKTMSNVKAR